MQVNICACCFGIHTAGFPGKPGLPDAQPVVGAKKSIGSRGQRLDTCVTKFAYQAHSDDLRYQGWFFIIPLDLQTKPPYMVAAPSMPSIA